MTVPSTGDKVCSLDENIVESQEIGSIDSGDNTT
jgi:hypothetical protein